MSTEVDQVNFFDAEVNECPYPAYQALRDQAPVWKDPVTGMFVVTRYEDIRAILLDPATYGNGVGNGANSTTKAMRPEDPEAARRQAAAAEHAAQLHTLYEKKGWVPAPTLAALDAPDHRRRRKLFDHAFRPAKVAELDPMVERISHELVDAMIERGGDSEYLRDFAIPLPATVICAQVGVPEADMPRIKVWTDSWIRRMGMMITEEEQDRSVELEIEAQHYFQPIFERLRRAPDETLLSTLVNTEIPELGRPLNDNELHGEMMADLFVGGAETTTNALSAGVAMLIEQPDVWRRLQEDPDRYLDTLVEEVLRLESPVQGLLREANVDVELHGVTIPAGAIINVRYASANRDERRYGSCPVDIDLEREKPRGHLAFGTGMHHCLGAPLARRELYYGFRVLVERFERMWFVEGRNDFRHAPNYFLRALNELHIGFEVKRP